MLILECIEWYNGEFSGLCDFNGPKYFHWSDEDNPNSPQRLYDIYDIDHDPKIEHWSELAQYKKIGQFKEEDILYDDNK